MQGCEGWNCCSHLLERSKPMPEGTQPCIMQKDEMINQSNRSWAYCHQWIPYCFKTIWVALGFLLLLARASEWITTTYYKQQYTWTCVYSFDSACVIQRYQCAHSAQELPLLVDILACSFCSINRDTASTGHQLLSWMLRFQAWIKHDFCP